MNKSSVHSLAFSSYKYTVQLGYLTFEPIAMYENARAKWTYNIHTQIISCLEV